MQPRAYVYILASRRNGTLYVGSTTDLSRRVWEHKSKLTPGFTSDYGLDMLVWYETYERVIEARHREYTLKRWRRAWKLKLVEDMNPDWRDLITNSTVEPLRGRSQGWVPDRLPLRFAPFQASGKGGWKMALDRSEADPTSARQDR